MDFIPNTEELLQQMLEEVGYSSIDELFTAVPESLRLSRPTLDDWMSEYEAMQMMGEISEMNTFNAKESYLGAGAYHHHVPAVVQAICSKSEFLTAYTPYQAEVSQGMLQSIFEFQSAICALTGLDVANASVYDGASACAEALLMALRQKRGRKKVLVAGSLHPNYLAVVEQYLECIDVDIVEIPYNDRGCLEEVPLTEDVAALLVQSPNFFGIIEQVSPLFRKAKEVGAYTILCANPLSYGLYASAGELGADIAVGDSQPLGLPLQYGGPYVGYMACRQELVRQLPGRIVGETVDTEGRRGFVLTLQAREQHIRREKATSNICTNQALAALASLVAMVWYGKEGIQKLAQTNFQRAMHLREELKNIEGVTVWDAPIFNEFVVNFGVPPEKVYDAFEDLGIVPGFHLGSRIPALKGYFLVAVTETKTLQQLEKYCEVTKSLAAGVLA